MKSQRKILIFEIILCIIAIVVMGLIAYFIYGNAFHINFVAYILPNWIVVTLLNWKKEMNTDNPKLRWFTFLLIIITVVMFIMFKPNISYKKGKDILASKGYENLYELQDKSIYSFPLKKTYFVPEAYLYAGEKNNVKYYILLSPIDGEIETEKIGSRSYIDMYFEMKYEQWQPLT